MWFAVISILPEMFSAIADSGISGRAIDQGKAQLHRINPRDFATGKYRRIDDRPCGGGPGMVMMAEPLFKAIQHAKTLAVESGKTSVPVVYLSPQGQQLNESLVQQSLDCYDGLILLCGRYEGIDQRIIDLYVDQEWSIGDYVLSGGELAAMVVMDSLIRRLPDVMSDNQSAVQDSFVDGLLDHPQYANPEIFQDLVVPEVLKSGHHLNIERWRFLQRYQRTMSKRPELLQDVQLSDLQQKWLQDQLKSS